MSRIPEAEIESDTYLFEPVECSSETCGQEGLRIRMIAIDEERDLYACNKDCAADYHEQQEAA